MSEKRKPDLVFTVKRRDKAGRMRTRRVELFRISQWPDKQFKRVVTRRRYHRRWAEPHEKRYRIRTGGRWFREITEDGDPGPDLCFSMYEFRDIFWRSIKDAFD